MKNVPVYMRIAEEIKSEWLSSTDAQGGKKLPTQEELAERFGVSRSTIVRTLSKLAAEGYIHSQQGSGAYIATTLPRETNVKCLSLIVPALHAPVIVQACRGVERRARQLGYQVLLASSEFGLAHEQELVMQHLQAGAKGILLYPVTRRRQDLATDYLIHWSYDVPVVMMDIGGDAWPCSQVQFDNYRLGYDMTNHLLQYGHRRIAFMHTWLDYLHSSIHNRQRGWETAMMEAGQEIPSSYIGWPVPHLDLGYRTPLSDADYDVITANLLTLHPRPDAVIAWNDEVAAHLTQTLINRGIRVPDEIRITGFDCEPLITRLFQPLFPTSKPDFVRLGELAVDALSQLLTEENAHPRTYLYPAPVLWREPCAGPMEVSSVVNEDAAVVGAGDSTLRSIT